MASEEEIFNRLVQLATEKFGRQDLKVKPEDDFFESLEIDSFQAMELLTELEEAFDIEIPDYEVQGVTTFKGLSEVIQKRL